MGGLGERGLGVGSAMCDCGFESEVCWVLGGLGLVHTWCREAYIWGGIGIGMISFAAVPCTLSQKMSMITESYEILPLYYLYFQLYP